MNHFFDKNEKFKTSKKFKSRLSEIVFELMIELNCTKSKVSNAIGIGSVTLGKAMNYGLIPKVRVLMKISAYLHISIEYLLARTDDESFEETDCPTTFQERFEELKKAKSLTSYKVAQKTGIDIRSFSTWKRKKYLPTLEFLKVLSEFFKCSIDFLVGRTDTPEQYKKAEDYDFDDEE